MRVSEQTLAALREQVDRKDKAAFALGVAMAEYEIEKARLRLANGSMPLDAVLLRIGALQHEFDGHRDTHMLIVVTANAAQKAVGEAALHALGLPDKGREFTIDVATGEVLELVAGAWVPVVEAA